MSWTPPPLRLAALVAAVVARSATAQETPAAAPPASGAAVAILSHADLERELDEIARASGGTATRIPIGTSRGGRAVSALRLARGTVAAGRPAILVVAALDGELAWTSGLAVAHARDLLASTDDAARRFLETTTLYLVPRANPDAAERRTSAPLAEIAATGGGVDDDRDGRNGEDGPVDWNGDGVISWMRVPDAEGEWIEDPLEPRALVRADRARGQRGQWKLVREALDADGDGEVGEDAPHDVVVNRNFPQGWQEHAPEAGRYATEEPEARALAEFLTLHGDVALVVTYGLLDNLAEKPKVKEDGGRRSASPSDGIPAADADLYAEIGKRWKALGGTSAKTDARDAGTFQAWAQSQRGLWTVNLAPWSVPLDEKAPEKDAAKPDESKPDDAAKKDARKADAAKGEDAKPSDDAKRLRWFDANAAVAGFRPWTAAKHPTLGDVELGGFAPYALVEPPAEKRAQIAATALKLLVSLGDALPRARVVEAEARELGGGTWRVDAVVGNESLLPLASALARRARSSRPARVRLELADGATLVAGPREELVSDLAGSGGRRELSWIVRAPSASAIAVSVDTSSAGAERVVPEVKR